MSDVLTPKDLGLPEDIPLPNRRDWKIGIVGFGWITRDAHLPAHRTAGYDVVAVADINAEARRNALDHGVPKVYEDFREMLADDEIDVVDLGTQPNVRSEVVFAAAERTLGVTVVVSAGGVETRLAYVGRLCRVEPLANPARARVCLEAIRCGHSGCISAVRPSQPPTPVRGAMPSRPVPTAPVEVPFMPKALPVSITRFTDGPMTPPGPDILPEMSILPAPFPKAAAPSSSIIRWIRRINCCGTILWSPRTIS